MRKKGEMTWETILKLVFAVIFLLFVLLMIYLVRDKLFAIVQRFGEMMRFGR